MVNKFNTIITINIFSILNNLIVLNLGVGASER